MSDRREKLNLLTAEQQAQLEQIVAKFELAWFRGGSWMDEAIDCRSAVRSDRLPAFRDNTIGIRVVLGVAEGRN